MHQTAGKEPLQRLMPGNDKIFRHPSKADMLIRKSLSSMYKDTPATVEQSALVGSLNAIYNELGCCFSMPNFAFVLSHEYSSTAQEEIFVLVEKVEGTNVPCRLNNNCFKLVNEIEKALVGVLDYYDAKIKNGGKLVLDTSCNQFMYGYTARDHKERLYYVDIEDRYVEFDPEKCTIAPYGYPHAKSESEMTFSTLFQTIALVQAISLASIEKASKIRLVELRGRLKDFLRKHSQCYIEACSAAGKQPNQNYLDMAGKL